MSRWSPPPILAATVVSLSLATPGHPAFAQAAPVQRRSESAAEKPTAATEPADEAMDDPWEERKLRAREDVEYLEAFLSAKQAQCREAELRYAHATAWKADIERQHQKGYAPIVHKNQTELSVFEALTQREMRRAELKDIEIRLARSRRRLKAVQRSGAVLETEGASSDDRLRELELRYERLRYEMDRENRAESSSKLGKTSTGS